MKEYIEKEVVLRALGDAMRTIATEGSTASEEYERGWKDGQEALREELWEEERENYDGPD